MDGMSWDMLAGYEAQKRDIEDTVLMSLTHPEIFDEITLRTRMRFERNRAKAVLFEGPPGTGKTTSAKIIASQVGIPLLYMPLESIMSKWYGEAEKRLADVFEGASNLGNSIIFIDEIDAIAGNRGTE
jgi:SpoVK/Ycf46/Vps4 family AAA+-type ATPase